MYAGKEENTSTPHVSASRLRPVAKSAASVPPALQPPPQLRLLVHRLASPPPAWLIPFAGDDLADDLCTDGPERGSALRGEGVGEDVRIAEQPCDPGDPRVQERAGVRRPVGRDPQH